MQHFVLFIYNKMEPIDKSMIFIKSGKVVNRQIDEGLRLLACESEGAVFFNPKIVEPIFRQQ